MLVFQRARAFVFSATLIVAGIVLYVPIALVMAVGMGLSKPKPVNGLIDFEPAAKPMKTVKRSRAV
ncbi:hypothetical protein [Asticcacaulis solisilvae]|uniref:hypothetical protein n=1 Tax=Asticcacaulis solisilvae TaxID=1217274 RepID=UPI003FD7D4D8